jgi:hypothetical protein
MPFAEWPSSLPQDMLLEHSHGPEVNVVAFRPQVGVPTLYQVGDVQSRYIRGRVRVSDAQMQTFLDFFRDDLRSGSRRFNWTSDSFDGATLRLQFDSDEAFTYAGMAAGWILSLNLWVVREVA